MKILLKVLAILLILSSCKLETKPTLNEELLKKWSVIDSAHINFLKFKTIATFDEYQFLHKELFDNIKVIIPINESGIELIKEGNKLRNNVLSFIPLPENRIVRFEFTDKGDNVKYEGKVIKPEQSKEIVKKRFSESIKPNQQIISLVFEDSIKSDFVLETVNWINQGFNEFVTKGLSANTKVSYAELDQEIKDNLNKYRLIYAIGRVDSE